MSRSHKEVFYKETLGPPFSEKEHWFSAIFLPVTAQLLFSMNGHIITRTVWNGHSPGPELRKCP